MDRLSKLNLHPSQGSTVTQKAKDEFIGLAYYAADLESSFLAGSPRHIRKPWHESVIGTLLVVALLFVVTSGVGVAIVYASTGVAPW